MNESREDASLGDRDHHHFPDHGDPDHGDPDHDGLRARLRAADPAASLRPADPAQVTRLLETTMTGSGDTAGADHRARSPLGWLVAAAATVLIAGLALLGFDGTDTGERGGDVPEAAGGSTTQTGTVTVLEAPQVAGARCRVPDVAGLAAQDVALRGTVVSVTDGVVVLDPTDYYAGRVADRVELRAPRADLRALAGAVDFRVGGEYLVAGAAGRVTGCGLSGPDAPALRALYDGAFPD